MKQDDNAIEIYVAVNGNDKWSGRIPEPNLDKTDGPFASIKMARDYIRYLKISSRLTSPVTVWLRGGQYFVDEVITFTPEDSAPVTYAAFEDEKPVLHGGKVVTGWQEETINGIKMWTADVTKIVNEFGDLRSLFVNGNRMPRTRLPKNGYFQLAGIRDPGDPIKWDRGANYFWVEKNDINSNWKNLRDVEIITLRVWQEERFPILSYDEKTGLVKSSHTSMSPLVGDGVPYARYFVENVFEALTEPGEWYFDKSMNKLFYIPMFEEKMNEVEIIVPVVQQLLCIEGKPEQEQYVENIKFKGLTFEYTDWRQPVIKAKLNAYGLGQDAFEIPAEEMKNPEIYGGSFQSSFKVPAAIEWMGARCCAIEDCQIQHIGQYGIELRIGCQSNRIVGNTITDMGAGGIQANGATSDGQKSCRTSNNRITDNHIYNGGHIFLGGTGILLRHSGGNYVMHNHIHDLYYAGISCGWVWGYFEQVTNRNRIEKNHIHHLGKEVLSDMAAIYLLGIQPGTAIRGNLVHDVTKSHYGGFGLNLDEGSSNIIIENNIFYNTSSQSVHQNYGWENIIRNNIFIGGKEGMIALSFGNTSLCLPKGCHNDGMVTCAFTFERNIVLTDDQPIFLGGLGDKGGNIENRNFMSDLNLFWDVSNKDIYMGNGVHGKGSRESLTTTFEMNDWQAMGMDVHSVVADPMFRCLDQLDFRLDDQSPAFAMGFKAIDMSDVGVRPKEKRN